MNIYAPTAAASASRPATKEPIQDREYVCRLACRLAWSGRREQAIRLLRTAELPESDWPAALDCPARRRPKPKKASRS